MDRDGSSTSAPRPSSRSRRSVRASRTSASPGSPPGRRGSAALTPSALRELAARHGIRPRKALGQHFLIEPSLARRIASLADVGPTSHVLEIGAGLGSLTVALAEAGGEVVAVELDRALTPALEEVVAGMDRVRVVVADAVSADWGSLLAAEGSWEVVANLPYNVAVPVVMRILDTEPRVDRLVVMVQREVGERLAARPGDPQYGAVSVRVAYRATAEVVRRVSPTVFWPVPKVESVIVSLVRRLPPVDVDEATLWRVVDEAFAQRRKTIRNALVRLGLDRDDAGSTLRACGIDPSARAEQLGLERFALIATRLQSTILSPDRSRRRRAS